MRNALLFSIGILLSATAWAATEPYFEFSPDFREAFLVSTATTVEQVFLPLNDHFNGIDFWVSNNSTPATVTFTMLSPSGATLTSRTVTIAAIADTDLGQRYTVTFPIQITTTPNAVYRVRVETTSITLRLYWAAAQGLLPHNAPPPSAYSSGIARIDGNDQAKSFLYALHETNESSPPVISNVLIDQPLIGQARIMFNASEPVDGRLRYGPQGQLSGMVDFTGGYQSCVPDMEACVMPFSVIPGTAYAYELTVRDVWGNESAITGNFTSNGTPPSESASPTPTGDDGSPSPSVTPPDTAAPVISNLRAVNITTTSAGIVWTTDEAANSFVVIQSLPFLINAGGGSDGTFELEHLVTVDGLTSGTLFRARVTTDDQAGNSTVATVDFQTASATATPPPGSPTPTPSPSAAPAATPTPTVSVGPDIGGEQTAEWSTPANGTPSDGYRIDIIGSDGKLIRTIRTGDTSVNLGDVPEGSTVIVYADNGGVYEKVGTPGTVRRGSFLERLVGLAPYLLGGLVVVIAATVGFLKYRSRRKPAPPVSNVPTGIPPPRPSFNVPPISPAKPQ